MSETGDRQQPGDDDDQPDLGAFGCRTFQKLATAAGEFRQECSTSHLGVLKTLASELAAEAGKVDNMLDPTSMRHGHTGDLRGH